MRRSLSFRTRANCQATEVLLDILVIFFGESPIDITVINDEVQNALKVKEAIPDVLYIVSYGSQAEQISAAWKAQEARTANLLARGSSASQSYLKEFAIIQFSNGKFRTTLQIPPSPKYSIPIGSLLEDGFANLVRDRGAYQIAPTGHVFKHPSGKRSRHFLLASELLSDEVDAYFVALCICAAAAEKILNTPRLYIDTMGIYPIARAIKDIVSDPTNIKVANNLEICSFHSHDGLVDFHPPDSATAIVLISASTSGNMARSMVLDKRFPSANVVTILDTEREGRLGTIIYEHQKYQSHLGTLSPAEADGYETPIELVGEYFAARGKRPRALTLTIEHSPKSLKEILNDFDDKDSCSLQQHRAQGSSSVDPITLSQSEIVTSTKIKNWLAEELRLRTPASVSHVLAAQGKDSFELANECARLLQGITNRTIAVVSIDQISELAAQGASGVLICSALVGNGHALRITARDIRELVPAASRHFIIGIGLPDTVESWNRLKQFLTQSGDPARPYLFSCWKHLPIGVKRPHDSWTRYAKLMQQLEHATDDSDKDVLWKNKDLRASLNIAMSVLEKSMQSMLPSNTSQSLKLTEGFVYWTPSPEQLAKANHYAMSYLAISSVLQNAREFENPLKRLKSTLYETVVLDPENFLRFNDGILQASLLRAANSFELDYSMSPEQSQSMREILEKIFINNTKRYGEASTEFAAALASGHLKLTDADSDALFKKVVPALGDTPAFVTGLLFYSWKLLSRKTYVPRFE